MAIRKNNTFLPTVFQTDTNKKFLNATMDQLTTDPNLETLYGYIGRKFAPTYQFGDSYVIESAQTRQDYQLEPSVIIQNKKNEITFFADYKDLLDKISYYGGLTNDHSRLFSQEYYSFDPKVSYDKLINFSQYYWLPNGPNPVEVTTDGLDLQITYEVTRDPANGRYIFKNNGVVDNTITLARGGVYEFIVDQPGVPFWIQSEIGTDGLLNATPTVSTRQVEGVENNGIDQGVVTFRVPPVTAQDRFLDMNTVFNVDYATPIPYSALSNKTLSQFLSAYPQYAGITGQLNGKYTVFIITSAWNNLGETAWTNPEVKDNNGNTVPGYNAGEVIPEEKRYGVWRILFVDAGITTSDGNNDPLLKLVYTQDVAINEQVYVKYGLANANKEFYRDYDGFFKETPLITATLGQLWIQDGLRGDIFTSVKIVEYVGWSIDVTTDILGKKNYTSPNGVEFTSGLKIQFGDDVIPTDYQNRQYYVEHVGDNSGIVLIPVDELVTPEAYNEEIVTNYPGEYFPDYITINRASLNRNAWARNNRWFHIDVITATAKYNGIPPTFTDGIRGQRPIVQFESDLLLINDGRIAKKPVDILDVTIKNAFTELQGKTYTTVFGIEIIDSNGDPIYPNGLRVIFAADADPLVKNKIYDLVLVQYAADDQGKPTGPYYIELSLAEDGEVESYSTTVVKLGRYKGSQWWYDGINWNESQQKMYLQQPPLFDVLDNLGKSISTYSRSSFVGTQIFGYDRAATGTPDSILNRGPVAPMLDSNNNIVTNFNLSYKNFQTQGDIKFSNFFNTDTFSYVDSGNKIITQKINLGYLQKIIAAETLEPKNTWLTVPESSKQYQLFSFIYTGVENPDNFLNINGYTNVFTLDITPNSNESSIPYVKVFQNFEYLNPTTDWTINGTEITINTELTVDDTINILVYSSEISNEAFFEIPENLDLNAQNIDIDTLTLGQLRNHLVALAENSTIVEGNILAQSNLRDVDIKQQGGTILQHSSPIPYSTLFLIDQQANFINSIRYAQLEYTKFKNKFLDLSLSLPGIDPTDPVGSVDAILTKINFVKNKSFPWYYSDMVPYGPLKNIVGQIGSIDGFQVFDPLKTNYEITEIFNDRILSNKAVLIYLNDQQLINGLDYNFNNETPSVDFLIPLTVGDILKIVEYSNTDGNYIPETPSKLGLWPSFIPERFYDSTYRTPTYVIRGHDGSITPSFNDYRDEFLLELEKRIYNNIKLVNKNVFSNIYSVIPGNFRSGDFNINEFNQILSTSFLSWVGNNKLDYSTNDTFQANDPFTWNYSSSPNRINDELLPGSWRACYMYFYDTYRPNITPWEMLGFASQPSWWEAYYGTAPYTGANKVLWDDLEQGHIRFGERQGIDTNYRRVGLSNIIPVDANGNLIPPAEILSKTFNNRRSASAWAVGQQGPVEFAWRTSSDFPFAVQQALALTKPAKFFATLIDVNSYTVTNPLYSKSVNAQGVITVNQQYLQTSTNGHLTQKSINFNGETIDLTNVYRTAGYINWIADYLINQGINPQTYLLELLENFQVNLAYKVSGFTDQKYLKVLAEQVSPTSTNDSVLIPNENYKIYLNTKPVPVDKISYSAVIIEKTTNGYSVRGYDLINSYFTIIPSIINNNATRITVLESSATVYKDYQNLNMNVPYGYEFSSNQQIVDFLISYERNLIAQGFTFDGVDPQLQQIKDWQLSVREFLYWSQQGWKPGSILVVSPVSDTLNAISIGSMIEGIEDSQYGTKVIDQNFNLIKNNKYNVYRTPTEFKITLTDSASVIGYVELNLVQYEHTLIFDNTTVFNDVIYQPESGNRQYRLKLIGQRTAQWDGSLSPEGFVYNSGVVVEWNQGRDYLQGDLVQYKGQFYTALQNTPASTTFQFQNWQVIAASEIKKGLLPNFATLAVESQSFYDSYGKIRNKDQLAYSHALIGFKQRQFMADLGLTETTQIEFYKGYIAQKGSKNAVDAFTSANINNITSSINMYEEWAMRVGDYGAVSCNPFIEIALDEKTFGLNPGVARFVDDADNNIANGLNIFNQSQVYKLYGEYSANVALNRTSTSNYDNDIPIAGYVNVDDVDLQIFDLANYTDLNNNIDLMGSGYLIWVAKDFTQNWNVYRVTETNNRVIRVDNSLNRQITFTTKNPHGLVKDSVFLVKNFIADFDGFYQVLSVLSSTSLLVTYNGGLENLSTEEGNGILFRLDSMRFQYMEDARIYGLSNPPNGWKTLDKIWIDDDAETTAVQGQPFGTQPNGTWKVYEKRSPWELEQQVAKNSYSVNDAYGTSVKMSSDNLVIAVGAPGTNNDVGEVNLFLKDYTGEYQPGFNLVPTATNTSSFGHSVDLATSPDGGIKLAVGAHTSGATTSNGYVYVYDKSINSQIFAPSQILMGNVSGDQFGYSLAFNQNGEWLYVGAPGNNTVYVYGLNRFVPVQQQIISINNLNTLYLSQNGHSGLIRSGDTIIQVATGAIANVTAVVSNTEIRVDTLTNFVFPSYGSSGNITLGNVAILGNLNIISGGNLTVSNVYPFNSASNAAVSSVNLNFTPVENDANCLIVSDSTKTYLPGSEYTLSGTTLTFSANIAVTTLIINQQPYYKLLNKLPIPTGNSWARYGFAISSSFDGAQLAVGAPGDTVADNNNILRAGAGAVYVWDRVIEAFNSVTDAVDGTGGQDYQTDNAIAAVYKVTIDGVETTDYTVIGSNTIRFTNPPAIGQVIFVEVNQFNILERLVGVDSLEGGLAAIQANAAFGTSLTICSNNCAIYIGAPNYNNGREYNSGAVWKFHNKGRLYGTNTGYDTNPQFKPVDTIRLNNFEVRVSLGLAANITVSAGDYITQPSTGANVRVVESTTGNIIKVSKYQTAGVFGIGANIAVNNTWVSPNVAVRLTTLNEFVEDVNDAGILGVSATNQNGYLRLDSDVTVAKDQLRILSGITSSGSTGILAESNTIVFAFMQIIINPFGLPGEYFGNKVKLAANAYMLVIGSARGTTFRDTTFDVSTTRNGLSLDENTTRFRDSIMSSGSVYIYELYDDPRNEVEHPGRYAYAQQLDPGTLIPGGEFGHALDIEGAYITIAAPNMTSEGAPAGSGGVYVFSNPAMTRGWKLIRYQQPKVDLDSVTRGYLYDTQTNLIKENLQFIDPAKGRVLGQAEQEISFKTEYDPAVYNRGFNPATNISSVLVSTEVSPTGSYWGDLQVGRVWWNLSKVRYIDYEQDSLVYRSLNWGRLFEGSTIEINEWISSPYLPSEYVDNVGDGVPVYPDDSAYVAQTYVDSTTGIIDLRYYYWVTGKSTVDPNNETRNLPTSAIADIIANPKNQNVPYAAMIKSDAVAFYNIAEYLSADNTIMHLDHQLLINSDIIHNEYQLVQKGNPNSIIPTVLVNKMIDSLSGFDKNSLSVPDPKLSIADRYGIEIRPRQSMFINRLVAINELVSYVNNIFAKNPIVEEFSLEGFNSAEPIPNLKLGEYDRAVNTEIELEYIDITELAPGYRVLVNFDTTQNGLWILYELTENKTWAIARVQSYKTSLYWNYIDWYASGYSASTKPDFSVATTIDALKLNAFSGTIIYIQNATGNNTWQLVEVQGDGSLSVVGIQNGTIQLDSALGDFDNNELGFGNQEFDSNRFDQNPNNEIRAIVSALYNEIFIDTLQGEFNNLFFVLVNYLLTEQNYVDWLFKSSFISITHDLRSLNQYPSYIRDNQTYYESYINEVKPYRTKIREYLLNYTGNDQFDGDVTDFDLPAYFDTVYSQGIFRSPSGEVPYVEQDEATWQLWPWNQWYNNRTLEVFRIQIETAGANYTLPPTVTITSADGRGTGATAEAILDGNTYTISNIRVTSSGVGYTSTPIVTVNGNGTEQATAYAVMYNPVVRTFDSKLKFDRIKYNSNVKVWTSNTTYIKTEFDSNGRVSSGDIVTHALIDGNVVIRKSYFINANITTGNTFIPSDYTLCPSSYFDNANDRIVGYYEPTAVMPAVDTINTPITLANAAFNTNTIYVYTAESMAKNMYINGQGVEAGYITEIIGNVTLMVNQRGYFLGNITQGISSIENINNMSGLTVGAYVSGQGIAFESTIVSVNYTTNSVNLSDSITANVAFANISFGGTPIKTKQVTLSTNVTLSTDTTIYGRFDSLEQLVPGVTYPTSVTQSPSFKVTPLFGRSYDIAPFDPVQFSQDGIALLSTSVYDQALYSLYANLALGTAPEDVITQGGAFIDTYHSRAPEELIPGITFDTLDLRVYTKIQGNANIVAYRYFDNMMDEPDYLRINGANIAQLIVPLAITDSNIYVNDATILYTPDPIFARPGVVFINGERITYYKKTVYTPVMWSANTSYAQGTAISNNGTNYVVTGNVNANSWNYVNTANISYLPGTNVLSQIRRGTQGTGAPTTQPYNADVVDASQQQRIPGTSYGNLQLNANVFYNNGVGTATDGTGLEGSITAGALFLKAGVLGSNVIPGISNPIVTEDTINTITTEDDDGLYTED
jgi:hypothetical protein